MKNKGILERLKALLMREKRMCLSEYLSEYRSRNLAERRGNSFDSMVGNMEHHYFSAFRTMLGEAVADGLLKDNPALRLRKQEKPRRPVVTKTYLDAEEVARLALMSCRSGHLSHGTPQLCHDGFIGRCRHLYHLKAVRPSQYQHHDGVCCHCGYSARCCCGQCKPPATTESSQIQKVNNDIFYET